MDQSKWKSIREGKDYSYISKIILQGKRLESLGFSIGDKI